jgi:hypothetical protein
VLLLWKTKKFFLYFNDDFSYSPAVDEFLEPVRVHVHEQFKSENHGKNYIEFVKDRAPSAP